MDCIKRWKLEGFLPGVEGECIAVFQPTVVLEDDFDAALAREAALREELASLTTRYQSDCTELSDSLTAAEQRNADTIAKLEMAASMMDDDERGNRFAEVCRLAIKSLKPTESGASE